MQEHLRRGGQSGSPLIVLRREDGAYVGWIDLRSGEEDIYAQRVTQSGSNRGR